MSEVAGSPISSANILLEKEVPVKSMTPMPSGTVLKIYSMRFLLYKMLAVNLQIKAYGSFQMLEIPTLLKTKAFSFQKK